MVKAPLTVARMSVAAVAAGLLAAVTFGVSAASASGATCPSSGKCYLADVAPASVTAGTSAAFTFTVTNEAATQNLGSIQVTAPAGFVITGASGRTASSTADSALFLNLSLSPGQSVDLTVEAAAPCGGQISAWGIEAKQSNQFNGSGNDFVLDPASDLSATVTGNCSLAFVNQPNGTAVSDPITTEVGSAGSPVSVEVLDGAGNLATTSTAAITMAIGANPGSAGLAGTTTVSAQNGVAYFSDLSINQSGSGYTLDASSPGIDPAISAYFDIWGVLQTCSANPCSGSSATKTTTGTVSTSSVASGEYLGVGLGGVSYGCGSAYQPVSDPLSFDVLQASGSPVQGAQFSNLLEVSKSVVQSSGHPGASTWQICYSSEQPFTTLSGAPDGTVTIGATTYYTGLLPDCSSTQLAPCVQARNKDNAGDVLVTFLATGDPFART